VTALLFLAGGLLLIALGVTAVLMRARQPSGSRHSVRSFQREIRALDPGVRRGNGESKSGRIEPGQSDDDEAPFLPGGNASREPGA
jgi:hypothetical protein